MVSSRVLNRQILPFVCTLDELFLMLDHLSLTNIFNHFAPSTRTCNSNGICRFFNRILYENSIFTEKCRQMFRGIKLDVCNKDHVMLFYSFDICNPNDDFIFINETRKQCLTTCNNQKNICLVFSGKYLCESI